jgi:acyl carrier protein
MKPNSNFPTEDRLIEMIAWSLHIPVSKINPHTDLADDLCLDPIDRTLLIAELENRLGIFLTSEEVARIDTVRDASQCLQLHTA